MEYISKRLIRNNKHLGVYYFVSYNYIRQSNNECVISTLEQDVKYPGSAMSYLNIICKNMLRDVDSIILSTRKIFDLKSLVPLYINEDNILIPVNGYKNENVVFINYCQIEHIERITKNETCIYFKNGSIIIINKSHIIVRKLYEIAQMISEYFEQLKVS